MIKTYKRKPINNYIEKASKVCDRCGNDLTQGGGLIHLPFKKTYISLCGICQYGIMFGYHRDFINLIKEEK